MGRALGRLLMGTAFFLVSAALHGEEYWELRVENKCAQTLRAAFIYYPIEDPWFFFKDGWYEIDAGETRLIGRLAKSDVLLYGETLDRRFRWFDRSRLSAYDFRSPVDPDIRALYYFRRASLAHPPGKKPVLKFYCPARSPGRLGRGYLVLEF